MSIDKNNGVLWYVLSLGMSMSYLPIKGIVLMIGSASLQGVIPVIIWQAVAAGFSIIALGNQKSKEDFTLSIVSLIFAIVLADFLPHLLRQLPHNQNTPMAFCNSSILSVISAPFLRPIFQIKVKYSDE